VSAAITLAPGTSLCHLPAPLPLERGGFLEPVHVAYECTGDDSLPLVVALGGISAGRHVAATAADARPGWWQDFVGPGRALDTDRYRVLGIDWLAGRGASTGPANATTAAPFPTLTTADQAAALAAVLDHLDVPRAHAIVGASYGGMVALALAARHPRRVGRLVVLGAAHRTHPFATALRVIQRDIVRLGLRTGAATDALALARALAVTTYRTADEFAARFDLSAPPEGSPARFPVAEYLAHQGRTFAASFGAEGYLCLSESIDLHDVDPAAVRVPTTLVAFESDTLVPPAQVRVLADALDDATLHVIPSRFGHDAFLKETAALAPLVARALAADRREQDATHAASGRRKDVTHAASGRPRGATDAVRAGIGADAQHGAVIAPIHLSSTFTFAGLHGKREYDYTRSGNPTRDVLGEAIARLEGGAAAVVTATGMAAIATVLQLLGPDDLLVAPHDCYGGTFRLIEALARKRQFRRTFADLTDPDALARALAEKPRILWIETPSNPLLRITDIRKAADAAHHSGALVVVDNTFLSPALQQPIALGADLVVHSTTKYLNGHSDVVGGAVVAAIPALHEEIGWWANCMGVTGAPFDAYLTLRGIRTLHARMRVHLENAERIVELLASHPAVAAVHYPGLPHHPGHDIAARQQTGFGAMVGFALHGGTPAVAAAVEGLRCFSLAESLGGVESLIAHPASMTHAAMTPEARATAGITDSLLRISVGIEDADDLCDDLAAGLDRAAHAAASSKRSAARTIADALVFESTTV
jgi:cystathionine gamma-synthase